jgi:hypothetical protein
VKNASVERNLTHDEGIKGIQGKERRRDEEFSCKA